MPAARVRRSCRLQHVGMAHDDGLDAVALGIGQLAVHELVVGLAENMPGAQARIAATTSPMIGSAMRIPNCVDSTTPTITPSIGEQIAHIMHAVRADGDASPCAPP